MISPVVKGKNTDTVNSLFEILKSIVNHVLPDTWENRRQRQITKTVCGYFQNYIVSKHCL